MYSTNNKFDVFHKTPKKTHIVSMFSPLSGSGKTTICVGLCQKASEDGLRVFYLNLEDNQTTGLFFDTESKADLSHILFYLKGKHKNISEKINSVKNTDKATGINYFSPPKSHLELDELTPLEYVTLLREIKKLAIYDYIFVDIHSSINEKTVSVLCESDNIVFVVYDDICINVKSKSVIKDFDILYKRQKINLYNKMLIVNNKFISGMKYLQDYKLGKIGILMNLPYDEKILLQTGEKFCINTTGLFGESLNELYRKL
jgi:MinD-like ATPase involved in chromosome partitioning or flagellar assembly